LEDRVLFDASPLGVLFEGWDTSQPVEQDLTDLTFDTLTHVLNQLVNETSLEPELGFTATGNLANHSEQHLLAPPTSSPTVPVFVGTESDWHWVSGLQLDGNQAQLQLVVVDGSILNVELLLKDISRVVSDPERVLILTCESDGVEQISQWLSQFTEVHQLHLLSHGSDGELQIGSTRIDGANLNEWESHWQSWSQYFIAGGDLLIYGCDLAASESGRAFVDELAIWTRLDIAASVDTTGWGHPDRNWVLEYQAGVVTAQALFAASNDDEWAWHSTLGNVVAADSLGVQTTTVQDRGSHNAIAMDSLGNYVVVWSDSNRDGSGWGVYAQRFSANGNPLGSDFRVNVETNDDQKWASIGMDAAGNFVITWTSQEQNANKGSVYAKRYTADGTALGTEFQVNSHNGGKKENSAIAVAPDGSFVIVWEGNGSGDGYGVYGQRFDSSGIAVGSNFLANTITNNAQGDASVSINGSGQFVVSWDDPSGLYFQKFNRSGLKVGGQVLASSNGGDGAILINEDGSVVLTWRESVLGVQRVLAKVYNSSGTEIAHTLVSDSVLFNQTNPSIVGTGNGTFMITWEGAGLLDSNDVYLRKFHADGTYASGAILVNEYTSGSQSMSSVAANSAEHFAVVWTGQGEGGVQGVYARIVAAAPVLDANYSPSLPPVLEGDLNPAGISINSLIHDQAITIGLVPGPKAIAITGLNTTLGTWQFSLDNGTSWKTIQASLINSTTNELALLLGPTARIRLLPFNDLHGSAGNGLTFRAWNMAIGIEGEYFLINASGSGTSFSSATDTISVAVNPVNDPPTFELHSGLVLIPLATPHAANPLAVQPDGKLIVAGNYPNGLETDSFLAKYLPNGSLDPAFADNGILQFNLGLGSEQINAMTVQSDGRILIVGNAVLDGTIKIVVARFNPDGSFDNSFGTGGIASLAPGSISNEGADIVGLPSGKVLIAGASNNSADRFSLIQLDEHGNLDPMFGINGVVTTNLGQSSSIVKIALQPDGKIIAVGNQFNSGTNQIVVARYLANGQLDTSFGSAGTQVLSSLTGNSLASDLQLHSDGRILIGGTAANGSGTAANGTDTDFAIVRLLANGVLDSTFNGTGVSLVNFGGEELLNGLAIHSDGKISLVGRSEVGGQPYLAVARLQANGANDTSFGSNGMQRVELGNKSSGLAIEIQLDHKLVIVGSTNFAGDQHTALLRLNSDGSLDSQFGTPLPHSGVVDYEPGGTAVILAPNLTIFDVELSASKSFADSRLILSRISGNHSDDWFGSIGTLGNLIEGESFANDGNSIGTVIKNSNGELELQFNGLADIETVNQVIQQITYRNLSATPPANVAISFAFDDGNSGAQGVGGALTATTSIIVQIANLNHPPQITIGPLDTAEATLPETNAGLVFQRTLTITDIDPNDVVTASIKQLEIIGPRTGLSSGRMQLLSMLTINSPVVAASATSGTLHWTFDSGSQTFDYLAVGQSLQLTYTVVLSDSFDSTAVQIVVTIQGTNDAPSLTLPTEIQLAPIGTLDAQSTGIRLADVANLAKSITDVDGNQGWGIALTEINNERGHWQFRLPNSNQWQNLPKIESDTAFLLNPNSRIRFVPDGTGTANPSLQFVAWDQSFGTNATLVSVPLLESHSALSSSHGTISQSVVELGVSPAIDGPNQAQSTDSSTKSAEDKHGDSEASNGEGVFTQSQTIGSNEFVTTSSNPAPAIMAAFHYVPVENRHNLEIVTNAYNSSNIRDSYSVSGTSGETKLELAETYAQAKAIPILFDDAQIWTRFFESLDKSSEQHLVERFQIGIPKFVASTASLLTVGYLAWIIRGGVLLTTFMSSLPTWKVLDIVPLLESAGVHDRETIEQIVDGKQSV
jgi:uncharacterized delta-60 repeat protein